MGVKGLTTYIDKCHVPLFRDYQLHDQYVVLDGNGVANQLYVRCCHNCWDCFGGDYDAYVRHVRAFLALLAHAKLQPLVVFDGGHEERHLKKVHHRMSDRLQAARAGHGNGLYSRVLPYGIAYLFREICMETDGVRAVCTSFECDQEAAQLAHHLNCPLISYDSDFYIFDVLYVPFHTLEMVTVKTTSVTNGQVYYYIPCKSFDRDRFLKSYNDLDVRVLPILAVLLGNDTVDKQVFGHFFKLLPRHTFSANSQQRDIRALLDWLAGQSAATTATNETDMIIERILERFKSCYRPGLLSTIKSGIAEYSTDGESTLLQYFGLKTVNGGHVSNRLSPPKISTLNAASAMVKYRTFHEKFIDCQYPNSFMDAIQWNTYFFVQQIEDFSQSHSHTISLHLVAAICKILNFTGGNRWYYYARDRACNISRTAMSTSHVNLPDFSEIQGMDTISRQRLVLNITEMNHLERSALDVFPDHLQLIMIAIKYCLDHQSLSDVKLSNLYAILICTIVLSCLDDRVKDCRCPKDLNKYRKQAESESEPPNTCACPTDTLDDSIKAITLQDSVTCLSNVMDLFHVDAKLSTNVHSYQKTVVHEFAVYQSVLWHLKSVNSLLNTPFTNALVSNAFNGTFLYNITVQLRKRTNYDNYCKTVLFSKCVSVYNVLQRFLSAVTTSSGLQCKNIKLDAQLVRHQSRKGRKQVIQQETASSSDYTTTGTEYNEDTEYSQLLNMLNIEDNKYY